MLTWRRALCGNAEGECVERPAAAFHVAVRDSRRPHHAHLTLTFRAWRCHVTCLMC
ncbi:DUF397 domain-containing protein [Actinocorallia lasiicapitis]